MSRVITNMCPVCKAGFFARADYANHIRKTVCGRTPPYALPDDNMTSASSDSESESDESDPEPEARSGDKAEQDVGVITIVSSPDSESGLEIVESKDGLPERTWTCPICSRIFYTSNQLKIHLSLHRKKKVWEPFPCYFCEKMMGSRQELEAHLGEHTQEEEGGSPAGNPDPVVCENKENSFPHSEHDNGSNSKPRSMMSTPKSQGRDEDKVSPRHKSRKKEASLDSSPTCLICNKEFKSTVRFKEHMHRMHTARYQRMRWCQPCKKTICSPRDFNRHLRTFGHRAKAEGLPPLETRSTRGSLLTEESSEAASSAIRSFPPPNDEDGADLGGDDTKTFELEYELLPQDSPAAPSAPTQLSPRCNICRKSFTAIKYLYQHHNRYHLDQEPDFLFKLRCRLCRAVFGANKGYRKHMILIHGERQNNPRAVPSSFAQQTRKKSSTSTPQRHPLKRAGGLVPDSGNSSKFTCGICGSKYDFFRSLEKHMNIHQKSFQCAVADCGHCSRDAYDLSRHMERCHPNDMLG